MCAVFDCRMCGHCCQGEGGIVLAPKDLERISVFLGLEQDIFIERYAVMHNGKYKIRTGEDGYCIFFMQGKGCSVHEGKPDICRAWPFFRGNLEDAVSLHLAKEFCPGIEQSVTHAVFAAEGKRYLLEQGLLATDASQSAAALVLPQVCEVK